MVGRMAVRRMTARRMAARRMAARRMAARRVTARRMTARRILPALLLFVIAAVPARAGTGAPVAAARPAEIIAPAPVEEGIRTALERIETAVNRHDIPAVLEVCVPDSAWRRRVARGLEGTATLDSLLCRERLGSVYMRGDTALAVVCEETSWFQEGRRQATAEWRSRGFIRGPEGWLLATDLPRDHAGARSIDLSIDLHPEEGTLTATARMRVEVTEPGEDRLLLALNRGLTIRSIVGEDGRPLPFTRDADLVAINLELAAGDSAAFTIAFDGSFYNERKDQGYSQVGITPAGSFASWVTDWYPHIRGTRSKSRGMLTFTTPAGTVVACSGRALDSVPEGNRVRQTFRVDRPLDFSFAAAPYFHRSRDVDGVDVGVYLLQGGDAKAELYIASCAKVIAFLHEVYGFYPYDGYAVVEIPSEAVGTLGGSSEQGMNLFPTGALPDSSFPVPLLAHEIGHGWWGNLVRSDGATIIDEGLAQMSSLLTVERMLGAREMRRYLRRGFPGYPQSALLYFATDAGRPGRDLPLATAQTGSVMHELADTKGFFVYEMLRETIGDEAFTAGLRAAVSRFSRKAIRVEDLEAIWSETSGRDLRWFFRQWFERAGAPEFRITAVTTPAAEGGFDVSGTVEQLGETVERQGGPANPAATPVDGKPATDGPSAEPYRVTAGIVLAKQGRPPQVETLAISSRSTPFRFHCPVKPDTVLFDPDYKILRWTPELRNLALLREAVGLREAGVPDSAEARMDAYLARVPEGAMAGVELGRWKLESGDLDGAESEARSVQRRLSIYDTGDPALARCELLLGKIADLRQQREQALGCYRRVLVLPEDPESRAEAGRLLLSPYAAEAPPIAADPALLRRCVGQYASPVGLNVSIVIGAGGALRISTDSTISSLLIPIGHDRFRLAARPDTEIAFSGGDGNFTTAEISIPGRVFHLERK